MGYAFWIRRFALALLCAVLAIVVGQVFLRDRPLDVALPHALSWGIVAASVYVGALFYRLRQRRHCELCRDTPLA